MLETLYVLDDACGGRAIREFQKTKLLGAYAFFYSKAYAFYMFSSSASWLINNPFHDAFPTSYARTSFRFP